MKELVKICKIHGGLTISETRKDGNRLRCTQCRINVNKNSYYKNRQKRIDTSQAWKDKNRKHVNEWNRKDRKENPDKYRRYEANYVSKHGIEKVRKFEVARIHGLTVDQYELLLNSQNNLCKICGKEESKLSRNGKTKRSLAVDHCHVCEEKGDYKIRGLLCGACNTAIGQFKDDPNLLLSAIKYLESHVHN